MEKDSDVEFRAFVGIDWADTKHDICVQVAGSKQRELSCIPHQVESIEEWACALRDRYGAPIAVALELSKGPIVYALQKYGFLTLFPINPTTLAKYREAIHPSGAKDDPGDAQIALELLVEHRDKLKALKPQSVGMRHLLFLVEERRILVNDKVRFTNRLGNALKQYFPTATRAGTESLVAVDGNHQRHDRKRRERSGNRCKGGFGRGYIHHFGVESFPDQDHFPLCQNRMGVDAGRGCRHYGRVALPRHGDKLH